MIKGTTITLYQSTIAGYNEFNEPIMTEPEATQVDGVLIAPVSADDIVDAKQLDGRHEVYQLAIPKGDTHEWFGATVSFWGKLWHVFEEPTEGMDENIPLSWNKKVMVERINGEGV